MFEPFQKFFTKTANRYGIAKEIEAAQICHQFRALIPEIFNSKKFPEKNIQPASFKRHILTVKTSSSAWAQEVIMRKEKIIEEMNKKAGEKVIKNLKTQLFS